MKKRLLYVGLVFVGFLIVAFTTKERNTEDPVTFKYEVKKLKENIFELKIIAIIEDPWHIYSQHTPPEGPSLPTSIRFLKNPLVEVVGKPYENGKLITKHENVLDVDLKYYKKQVEFIQKIKLKASVKTNLMGSIEYMSCTDERCLKPTTEKFTVALND